MARLNAQKRLNYKPTKGFPIPAQELIPCKFKCDLVQTSDFYYNEDLSYDLELKPIDAEAFARNYRTETEQTNLHVATKTGSSSVSCFLVRLKFYPSIGWGEVN